MACPRAPGRAKAPELSVRLDVQVGGSSQRGAWLTWRREPRSVRRIGEGVWPNGAGVGCRGSGARPQARGPGPSKQREERAPTREPPNRGQGRASVGTS
jgi:hypothetical protein